MIRSIYLTPPLEPSLELSLPSRDDEHGKVGLEQGDLQGYRKRTDREKDIRVRKRTCEAPPIMLGT